MSGEKDDMEDEAHEDKAEEEMESGEPIEETSEVEELSEEATEDKVEEGSEDELELDLDDRRRCRRSKTRRIHCSRDCKSRRQW